MARFNITNPSGFPEFGPAAEQQRQRWLSIISAAFARHGFISVTTPLVEREENLLGKGGNAKEMYVLKRLLDEEGDRSHSGNALRFDQTVPLALYVARHQNELTFPFKRSVIGPVFRGERAQKGRFRQFDQCDIDVIGNGELSLLNDAMIPAIIVEVFQALNIGAFVVQINNRKILSGLAKSFDINVKDLLDAFDDKEKISDEEFYKRLETLAPKVEKIKAFKAVFAKIVDEKAEKALKNSDFEFYFKNLKNAGKNISNLGLEFEEGVSELEMVFKALVNDLGVDPKHLVVDPFLARGLDYYTGTVYETKILDHLEFGSVCSGGRYEDLASVFTGKTMPGVGISIGLTRLFSQCLEAGLIKPDRASPTQVLLVAADDEAMPKLLSLGSELRALGCSTENYLEPKKLAKQFDYADKLGIPYVVVMGERELAAGVVQLKKMESGEMEAVEVGEVVEVLRNKINLSC